MKMNILQRVILIFSINIFMTYVVAQEPLSPQKSLSRLVNDMLDLNPGVQSAQAALDAANARERAGNQPFYNPELEFDAEDTADQSASIGISQSLDWSNKRKTRGDVASYEREAVAAQLHQVRQKLAIELLNGITQNDVALQLSNLASEREQLMQQFADLAAQRRQTGDLNQVELDLARLALAEAQLQKSQALFNLTDARLSMESVLGENLSLLITLPDSPTNADIVNPNIDQMLNNLPAIRVQVARLAAASKRVKLRTLEKRPDPTFGVRVGQEESNLLAGISISVPLYIRNNFSAEVDGANADRMQIELEAQDIFRRARAKLSASLERYQLTNMAWDNWLQTGQESLGNQLSVLERLWRAGEISTTDYLVQINQTLETRAAAVELRGQLWQSWFNWLEASGQIDLWLGISNAP